MLWLVLDGGCSACFWGGFGGVLGGMAFGQGIGNWEDANVGGMVKADFSSSTGSGTDRYRSYRYTSSSGNRQP
jgi:hypothetical protein